MPGAAVTVDTSGLKPLLAGLDHVDKSLADESNTRLRAAAGVAGGELVRELQTAARSSPTPQAGIVASSARVVRGRLVAVELGGSRRVGRRATPAGVLVWGSEHGGANFDAPAGGSYWIAPAVARYSAGGADRAYQVAANAILHDAGLL